MDWNILYSTVLRVIVLITATESVFFDLHENSTILNIETSVKNIASIVSCTVGCMGNCTSVTYNHSDGECKHFETPLGELKMESGKPNMDVLIILPCEKRPCLNDGVCMKDEGDLKGYKCACKGTWGGEHCECKISFTVNNKNNHATSFFVI